MYRRHDEVPVFESREAVIKAEHYNHAQLALNRLGEDLRMELPGLRTLELIVQRDAWIVIDRAFNDIPIVAWSDFVARGRESLSEPIRCRVRLYHANAGIILLRVLDSMDQLLGERLKREDGQDDDVLPFAPRE